MAVYLGKILELVAIEKNNERSCLSIKLSFEQEVELFWEIDSDTAENLMTIAKFAGNHKYRLSLHTPFDPIKKQNKSLIIRTYRKIVLLLRIQEMNNFDLSIGMFFLGSDMQINSLIYLGCLFA